MAIDLQLQEVPHNELYHEGPDYFGYVGGGASQLQQHSQVQQSQMSAMTELFQEQSLPKLSPISYSSQLHLTGGAAYRHMEPERGPDIRFPNGSPSLRVPTRMALSLQNEESKSGSKISLPSSRSSRQGSKASILGSRTSVQGSRSQIFHTAPSREDIPQIRPSFLLGGHRESQEDDSLSLQLSRTASPLLDESQVPTRDSPNVPPLATSHALGHGKKDFASLTCIINHPAVEEEELTLQEELWRNESLKAENLPPGSSVEFAVPKRKSLGTSLGELTTLARHDEIPEFSSDREEKLTVTESSPEPSEQKVEEEETGQKKPSPAIKKPRSRAMSKLEKLTSLDYIRASLRLKKKRVSFQKTPESTPKSTKKKKKKNEESEIFRNKAALMKTLTPPQSPSTTYPQQTHRYPSNPSRYPPTGDFFNPEEEFELQGEPYHPLPPNGRRQRAYTTELPSPQLYAQLSQSYYPQMTAYQPAPTMYPQLSQPYYRPPLEAYYPQPYPAGQPNPYSRRYSHEIPSGYPGMVGPNGYPNVTSPDHERYRSATTPDRFMEPGYLRTHSPDRFTDTSTSSDRYRARSPDRFTESSYMSDRYNMDSFIAGRYTPERYPQDMIMRMQERYVDPHQHPGTASPSRFSDVRTPDTLVGSFDDGYRGGGGRPDRFLDSMEHGRHYSPRAQPLDWVVDGFEHHRDLSSKNARRFSDGSTSDKSAPSTSSKSKVSWDSEIIEYPRPPSDESDIDLNL